MRKHEINEKGISVIIIGFSVLFLFLGFYIGENIESEEKYIVVYDMDNIKDIIYEYPLFLDVSCTNDLRFYSENEEEIYEYICTNEGVYVLVPQLNVTNTTIWMYYGIDSEHKKSILVGRGRI